MERGAGELKNDGNDGKGNKEYFACSVLNHRCNTIQLGLTKENPWFFFIYLHCIQQ